MLNAKKHRTHVPRLEKRRRDWMSSETAFMRFGGMLLLPHKRVRAIGFGVNPGTTIGVEQLLKACRKNGLKSKG